MCVYCFDALTTHYTGEAMLPPAFPQANWCALTCITCAHPWFLRGLVPYANINGFFSQPAVRDVEAEGIRWRPSLARVHRNA
eukprot:1035463-Prorocentrum_minimum.AAC.1